MSTLHDELAELQSSAAHHFSHTTLARDVTSVRRRVRRDRGVTYAIGTLAVAGLGGGTVYASMLGAGGTQLAPADASPSTSASASLDAVATPSSAPIEDDGSPTLALDAEVTVYAGDRLATVAALLGQAFDVSPAVAAQALHQAAPGDDAEGWIDPAGYQLPAGTSLTEAATLMVGSRASDLERLGVSDEDSNEVLTLASIIEVETTTHDPQDMAVISAVLSNRIEMDMQLQLDSTVLYAVESDGPFTTDTERAVDSPYNTYLYAGLPPGPIATPSDEAIEAALHPADSEYLYYVTTNRATGAIQFAETYDEHMENVMRLQEWLQENGESTP